MTDDLINAIGPMTLSNLMETIEAQAKRIAELDGRLEKSPYGDDKLDELEFAASLLRHRAEKAEAALAAARAALLEYADRSADGNLRSKHAPAIAAALDERKTIPLPEEFQEFFDIPVEKRLGQPTGSGHGASKSDVCPACCGICNPMPEGSGYCEACKGTGKKEGNK